MRTSLVSLAMTSEQKRSGVFEAVVPARSNLADAEGQSSPPGATDPAKREAPIQVGLLTGGNDRPYALGVVSALKSQGIVTDFIASDDLDAPELHNTPLVNFLNLRGDQSERVSFRKKMVRLISYYARLVFYAATARPRIFHILWNNKFELIDRIVLMLYYKLLGKKIVFTAHNVNAAKRDAKDSLLNRVSLRFQYRMTDHIFVHTERMKRELLSDFGIRESRVSVIPFGINNTIPRSELTIPEAKQRLGVRDGEKTALFFGQIAPYKGLEYLVAAMAELTSRNAAPRLIIAGKVKRGLQEYWDNIKLETKRTGIGERIIERIEFIPDSEVELYFKAADVVVIPYVDIFQSGVPFLAYSFGVPIIATDVGSLREDIVEGKTGLLCRPRDPGDLAKKIEAYFTTDLYSSFAARREEIRHFANDKYSWNRVGEITRGVYGRLLA
jgi:D-inositol-3-phosphate glycosyltransferase